MASSGPIRSGVDSPGGPVRENIPTWSHPARLSPPANTACFDKIEGLSMDVSRIRRTPDLRPWRSTLWVLFAGALLALPFPALAAVPPRRPLGVPPGIQVPVLDEADGPVYVVEAYPRVLSARFPGLKVLAEWEGAALVAGPEGAIDSLAALGYEVRRVQQQGLLPAVPEAAPQAAAGYDARVQWVMDQVVQSDLVGMLNGLTGETSVTIGGGSQVIATRNSNLTGCRLAEQYVFETLQAAELPVEYQTYGSSGWRNVIATLTGVSRPGRQILVTAHLDDMPGISSPIAPGADDNGSGSVTVLRAAQIMAALPFQKTIRFICFTGEEQGLLGSYAYAVSAAARGDTIDAVVNLDMIAYESNGVDVIELHAGTTVAASEAIADAFMNVNTDYGLGFTPAKITAGAINASDHARFWERGYPAILAIEDYHGDFTPLYHTTGDRVATLDQDFFTRFAKAAVGTVATLAGPAWTVGVELQEPTAFIALGPNPTPRGAVLRLSLPAPAEVRLEFFDLTGRRLRTLGGGVRPAGVSELHWDGLDARGNVAPAGVVFYRASVGEKIISGRLIVLR